MQKKIRLYIPPDKVREPIIFKMVTKYNLEPNVIEANIHQGSIGEVLLELNGTPVDIESGILFLRELDIKLEEMP